MTALEYTDAILNKESHPNLYNHAKMAYSHYRQLMLKTYDDDKGVSDAYKDLHYSIACEAALIEVALSRMLR